MSLLHAGAKRGGMDDLSIPGMGQAFLRIHRHPWPIPGMPGAPNLKYAQVKSKGLAPLRDIKRCTKTFIVA